jgi:carboxymethylenebutenolidase
MASPDLLLERPVSESIRITTLDGTFSACVARPESTPSPAIVVLHEAFGVNADILATCHELAGNGFIALCPDLFWRQEPGLDLSHWTEAEWRKGIALYNAYNLDCGVSDIVDTVTAARALGHASGKVGVIGCCLGGLMTFLTAARGNADAAVAYYGEGTEHHLEEAEAVSFPMPMHLGEEDEFISKAAQRRIREAFVKNSNVKIYSYSGCSHAFARHAGTHYDPAAAVTANGRTRTFFDQRLR